MLGFGSISSLALSSLRSIASVVTTTAAGRAREKRLTRQRQRADMLAQRYKLALEQNKEEAQQAVIAATTEPAAPDGVIEIPAEKIDFEALAASRKATRDFIAALDKIQRDAEQEEAEIFQFIMSIA